MQLKQENMTVGKYASKFEELEKYSAFFYHPDERMKYIKFEGGLRPELRKAVGILEISDFPTLIHKCHFLEGFDHNKDNRPKSFGPQSNKKRNNEGKPYDRPQWKPQSSQFARNSSSPMNKQAKCLKCHGHVFFECGQPKAHTNISGPKPRHFTTGRVYTMTGVEADQNNDLIQGKCFIKGKTLNVLYDSGATHGSWDQYLPLIEFTYNNSFHSSIGMTPYETLYGRRCRTPLCWFETGENLILGPELVQQTMKKIKMIQEKLRMTQSRQKSYADRRKRPLEFHEGDHVFLKVTPTTRIGRVMKSKKLTPRFIGPYQILKKIGPVAYQISLPPFLSNLHNVFHVSQLRKYISDLSHVIIPDTVQLKDNLTYETMPVQITDRRIKQLRGKQISLVKVIWNEDTRDATWELEEKIRKNYPYLF
uniref:Retrotransposable element Tf2 n=1 Tax=Cajanus cajan TaxID=3821 RepID=A0A151RQG0_CAJCA|nr:Retrotransposable element Tf2 [Cajanus cajan]